MNKTVNNKKRSFNYKLMVFSILSFAIPLIIYILTLEKKLIGGDTTWYALHLPIMQVMVPTGYPTFSIIGKIFSLVPLGELAYRLNIMSAIFGGLTTLLLFLAVNKLVKNVFISFTGSLTFAFLFDYWTIANRLEFDTINSFFIALILFSTFLYTVKPERKNLYFFAAALGLSLTNHPIAFFIMPAFVLYIILVRPSTFKRVKAVLLSILFFFLPLTFYAWLPIRSLQGYGPVTTLRSFIYYITGRNVTGVVHGSSFTHWDVESFSNAGKQFIEIIYSNLGIVLLLIALLGLAYLFRKNWRFAISSIFLIILNIIITILYLGWFPPNYTLNIIMVISLYITMGLLFIYDRITLLFEIVEAKRISGTRNTPKNISQNSPVIIFKYIAIIVLLLCFMVPPVFLVLKNYNDADRSEPLEIYKFWNKIFDYMEDGSSIYVMSSASNIGEFINIYERPGQNITFITHKDKRYTSENIKKDLEEEKKVYFVNIGENLNANFNMEIVYSYRWERLQEHIGFYEFGGEKKEIRISHDFEQKDYTFGEKLEIEYRMINNNKVAIDITSLELSITDNIDLLGLDKKGTINIEPSLSRGMYMWVKTFPVQANDEINIILLLQCKSPGKAMIDFKITSQATYFEAEIIEFEISS